MKLKPIILIFPLLLFAYLLLKHLSCSDYNGNFHFSSHVTSFHLNELTSSEGQAPIFIVRLFHNKMIVFLFDIFNRYIQFFNIFYLINIVGLAGLFGLLYFYFSLVYQKIENKFIKIFGIIILLLPLLEIFQLIKQAFFLRTLYLILPYQAAALMGLFFFLKQNKRVSFAIYFLLLFISVGWIIVFQQELLNFCTT